MRSIRNVVAAAILIGALAASASAHPEGFSGLRVRIHDGTATAVLSLHTRDLSQWFPPTKFPDYANDVMAAMAKAPDELLEVRADGKPVAPINVKPSLADVGLIEIDLDYPIGESCRELQVWAKHLPQLPRGHQQMCFAVDGRVESPDTKSGALLGEGILSTDEDTITFEIPPTTAAAASQPNVAAADDPRSESAPARISFFLLGIEHIVTGYDHLLFLAAVLLVCKNFREAAAVVTFFTVAHSITLTLAALDIVRMPARIVEPAIAASIVYVGLENIFGRHRFAWRAGVTFAFGLVHGLGFASALREVGLGSTPVGVAMPLLKFSVGLETGQLCIAAVILQIMLMLKRSETFERRWVPAGSVLVSLVGMYWLVTRVFEG